MELNREISEFAFNIFPAQEMLIIESTGKFKLAFGR